MERQKLADRRQPQLRALEAAINTHKTQMLVEAPADPRARRCTDLFTTAVDHLANAPTGDFDLRREER